MGKVVEKVVAEMLSDEVERKGLLGDGQFGSRKKIGGRCCSYQQGN
jgi:hypothetical protein